MTLKSDVKFGEKLICCFKNDKNLVNFDPSTQKVSNICTLIGPFKAKYIKYRRESKEELSFMTLKSHTNLKKN